MESAAIKRRLDVVYVHRGGVCATEQDILDFLSQAEVEPDTVVIQKYLERRGAAGSKTLSLSTAASGSPPSQQQRHRDLVPVDDCLEIVRLCIDVQKRKLIGGNDQHYLHLAWSSCGGDEGREGLIRKQALDEQLQSFGIAFESIAMECRKSTIDGDDTPMINFGDVVSLVSVNKEILDVVARHDDPQKKVRLPKKILDRLSHDERHQATNQAMILVRFKHRLRAVVTRRRELKRLKEEEERLAQSHHAVSHTGGHKKHKEVKKLSKIERSYGPKPAHPSGSVAPSSPRSGDGLGSTSARSHHASSSNNANIGISPAREGEGTAPVLDDGPVALHLANSHHVPFGSTKVERDWIGSPLPAVPRRRRKASPPRDVRLLSFEPLSVGNRKLTRLDLLQQKLESLIADRFAMLNGGEPQCSDAVTNGNGLQAPSSGGIPAWEQQDCHPLFGHRRESLPPINALQKPGRNKKILNEPLSSSVVIADEGYRTQSCDFSCQVSQEEIFAATGGPLKRHNNGVGLRRSLLPSIGRKLQRK